MDPIVLIIIAGIAGFFSTKKYEGLIRVFVTLTVSTFYFFVLVAITLLSGKL
jgi:hypothetical protein